MSVSKKNLRTPALIIALFVSLLIAHVATGVQAVDTGDGPYIGEKLSPEELQQVIQRHAEWLKVYQGRYDEDEAQNDKRRADLSGLDLSGLDLSSANLSGANLSGANLSGANLFGINLPGANLIMANLSGSFMYLANLSAANLFIANLSGAFMREANLSGAFMRQANLPGANLSGANLFGADLSSANLSGADLSRANLNWLDLSKVADYISAFLGAKGLSSIRVKGNVPTTVDLRRKFKEAGFKNEEKSLTSALRKYELRQGHRPIYSMVQQYLIGGKLTDFGANPAGALIPLVVLIFVFVWFYLVAIRRSKGNAGIWRVRPENRLIKDAGESDRELVTGATLWRSLLTAFYFSILSAFYFGWREFNVSNWIVRTQKKEYTLQATGWVRTTSGIQSLISLYLVVLFLVAYFGNLFE